MSSRKKPEAPRGSEKEQRHTEASQEGPGELQTQEQVLPARSGQKQSSRAAKERLRELRAGCEQTQTRLEDPKALPQPGAKAIDQQSPEREDQLPKSCQVALPEPSSKICEDSSQKTVSLQSMVTAENKTAPPFLPMPGPKAPKGRKKAMESQAIPRPLPSPERNINKNELDQVQKRLQDTLGASGIRSPRSTRPDFMKCLLDVEEQEQAHCRASKAQTLMNRKSSKNKTSVHAPGSVSNSDLSLTSTSAPTATPSWARPMVSGPSSIFVGAPALVMPIHTQDSGCRWPEPGSQAEKSYVKARQESEENGLLKLCQGWEERSEKHLTPKQEEAFRSYFDFFNGPGEIDARSLENVLQFIDFPLKPSLVEETLRSADINGDGHVDFKDFLTVLSDSARFLCSVEQNILIDMSAANPYTLFFDILSLLVEMMALPEEALEEIANYYQKKLKEGSSKIQEIDLPMGGGLRPRKKLSYNPYQMDSLEVPERRVLRILSRLKQQNYAANLQSPYAQVPCIPICPRLEKRSRRKHGNRSTLDHYASIGLSPDPHGLLFHSGPQRSREHGSDSRKWLNSVSAPTH